MTWAAIVAAFVLSLEALSACDFVDGHAVFYELRDEDQGLYGDPCNPNPCNETFAEVCVPFIRDGVNEHRCEALFVEEPDDTDEPDDPEDDPNYQAQRDGPVIIRQETFTLGVYKARVDVNSYSSRCIAYNNQVTDLWLDDGAAEGTARFFGTLAATLGGLSMVAFLGLAASGTTKKLYGFIFGGILFLAAFFQMFIFTLFSSEHCHNDYWAGYISKEANIERIGVSATCELGDGGVYALIALILYLFAALLAMTKWFDPSYNLCLMEWDKDFSKDDGHFETNRKWVKHHGRQDQAASGTPPKSPMEERVPMVEDTEEESVPMVADTEEARALMVEDTEEFEDDAGV